MGSFFLRFDTIIDEGNFVVKCFHSTWGWSDEEDVMKKANATSLKRNLCFIDFLFNQITCEYQREESNYMTNKENTVNNAMEYADYSIGKFF
jgi:hypothetical protein